MIVGLILLDVTHAVAGASMMAQARSAVAMNQMEDFILVRLQQIVVLVDTANGLINVVGIGNAIVKVHTAHVV
jgi:hypothetical protein